MFNLTSRPRLVRHQVVSPRWTAQPLTIALLSDFHMISPWTTSAHLRRAVDLAMSARPDLIVLAGDFLAAPSLPGHRFTAAETLAALAGLSAPLGVFGTLGNHDWKDCAQAQANGFARSSVEDAFAATPFRLLKNSAAELPGFWLVGLDSQCPKGHWGEGFHDSDRAFSSVPKDAASILIAHEPDYFAEGDTRAFLQLSGHTHGGQGNFFGWRPMTPSRYGQRYAHGHITDHDRHLIVSGGLGSSGLPLRINQPPEVTLVTISG